MFVILALLVLSYLSIDLLLISGSLVKSSEWNRVRRGPIFVSWMANVSGLSYYQGLSEGTSKTIPVTLQQ